MPKFILNGTNGVSTKQNPNRHDLYHDVAISAPGITAGTLVIKGKKVGADIYEDIPDGTINLSAPTSIQFTGSVQSYEFTVSGIAGSGGIAVSDTSQRA